MSAVLTLTTVHIKTDKERENYATKKKRQRHADKALLRQWQKINLSQESFILPFLPISHFVFWKATLLKIFEKFVTIDLVTQKTKILDLRRT